MTPALKALRKRLGLTGKKRLGVQSGRNLGTKASDRDAERWLKEQERIARAAGWKPEQETP